MLIPLPELIAFIGTSVLFTLMPGPDIIFVIAQGLHLGKRAGLYTALGLAFGNFTHTALAALGVSIIFRTSSTAFNAVTILGTCYLLYLAFRIIQKRHEKARIDNSNIEGSGFRMFFRGVIMNILNPKVALFFLAFLPQFTDPSKGAMGVQMILLGTVFVLQVVVIFGIAGVASGMLGKFLTGKTGGRFTTVLSWSVALVYVGLAVRLLVQ